MRQIGIGEIKYEMVARLLPVEPTGDGLGGKFRVVGKRGAEHRGIDNGDLPKTGERLGDLLAKIRLKRSSPGSNHGDGSRVREMRFPVGRERVGEAARQRDRDRLQNGGMAVGERDEVGM